MQGTAGSPGKIEEAVLTQNPAITPTGEQEYPSHPAQQAKARNTTAGKVQKKKKQNQKPSHLSAIFYNHLVHTREKRLSLSIRPTTSPLLPRLPLRVLADVTQQAPPASVETTEVNSISAPALRCCLPQVLPMGNFHGVGTVEIK